MQLLPMPRVDHSSPKARGGAVSSGRLEVPTGGLKISQDDYLVYCIIVPLFCYWRFVHVFFSISISIYLKCIEHRYIRIFVYVYYILY